jgi:Mrp family chromosome partitioning ATPase
LAVTLATDWAGPAFEVDQFGWTSPVTDLVATGGADLDAICQKIISATRGGSQVVAIGSSESAAGGTTLMLCLAQRLAAMKLKSVLVDADFASPALAERLGMSPPFGWEDIAEHEKSLCDVLIESVQDGLALLPLRGAVMQPARLAGDLYWRTTLEALKGRFRLVLLDGGCMDGGRLEGDLGGPPWLRPDCGIDMAIVVGRDGDAGRDALMSAVCRLQDCDIDVLGVVENFCQPEAQRLARQRPRAAVMS